MKRLPFLSLSKVFQTSGILVKCLSMVEKVLDYFRNKRKNAEAEFHFYRSSTAANQPDVDTKLLRHTGYQIH